MFYIITLFIGITIGFYIRKDDCEECSLKSKCFNCTYN